MATDALVYLTLGPYGLWLALGTLTVALLAWRSLLGERFEVFGLVPLAAAYGSALVGLLVLCFVSSYLDFSGRVALGWLPESQRWSLVPGWAVYMAVLSLWIVLPGLALVCVPLAAMLIRRRRLGASAVGMIALVLWLAPSLALFALAEKGEWERANLLRAFVGVLKGLLPGILLVPVPFFLSLLLLTRRRQA